MVVWGRGGAKVVSVTTDGGMASHWWAVHREVLILMVLRKMCL